jgi:sugar (pentulose or hexulose) kinase
MEHPTEITIEPDSASAYVPLAEALRELLIIAENTELNLGCIYGWHLMAEDILHDKQPTICGQSSENGTAADMRARVTAWALAFDGSVIEDRKRHGRSIEAHFIVGGIQVCIWNQLRAEVTE